MEQTQVHVVYQSPFTWRYGSNPMRVLWGEKNKRVLMRKVWYAAAVAMHNSIQYQSLLDKIRQAVDSVDIAHSFEVEKETHHDVVAELYVLCECVGEKAASLLHTGMTSSDVVDNVEAIRVRESADIILKQIKSIMWRLGDMAFEYAGTEVMGYTHLQEAQRTTQGHRFALYLQDFQNDLLQGHNLKTRVKGKGLKGAVGSYEPLTLMNYNTAEAEQRFSELLDLPLWPLTNQTSPRKQTVEVVQWLSNICLSAYRVAQDLRLLASPLSGSIWRKRRPIGQVGSSAMPHKKNPITEEKICSLARWVHSQVGVAWSNAAANMLERTLDDSANTRIMLPSVFLATNEVLMALCRVLYDGELDRHSATEENTGAALILSLLQSELIVQGAGQSETRQVLRRVADAYRMFGTDLRTLVEQNQWIARHMTTHEIRSLFKRSAALGPTKWISAGEEDVEITTLLGLVPLVENIVEFLLEMGAQP